MSIEPRAAVEELMPRRQRRESDGGRIAVSIEPRAAVEELMPRRQRRESDGGGGAL